MGLLMMNLRYPLGKCPEDRKRLLCVYSLGCSDGLRPNIELDWRESFGIASLSIC